MSKKDVHIYPAVFEKTKIGYSVLFPDLPGCFTVGISLEETNAMAREVLGLHLWSLEHDSEDIPVPSTIDAIQTEYPGEIIGLVEVSPLPFRTKLDTAP